MFHLFHSLLGSDPVIRVPKHTRHTELINEASKPKQKQKLKPKRAKSPTGIVGSDAFSGSHKKSVKERTAENVRVELRRLIETARAQMWSLLARPPMYIKIPPKRSHMVYCVAISLR